jgi:succinoglycan biosynthesis transport protein ExoP
MAEPQKSLTLVDYLAVLRRRRLPMLYAFAAVLIVVILLAYTWPATYRATGTILIEQQELPIDLVRSTISSYADQRLQVITQRVMTTENLFKIIQRFDLYADRRKKDTREKIYGRMRDDIHFEIISADVMDPRSGRPTKASIAFSVSFSSRSPDIAARVANELVSLYLQENLESRKQRSADATSFLTEEADRLSKRMDELGIALSKFKSEHQDDLPELSQLSLQIINRAEDELRDLDSRASSLDQQIVYLDAQLAQLTPLAQVYASSGERVQSPSDRLKYLRTEYARVSAIYSPDHPDVQRMKSEIAGLEKSVGTTGAINEFERQLADAKAQLASVKERYAPDHPDVIKLDQLVAGLTAQLKQSQEAEPSAAPAADAADNPAYIQIKAQREASANDRASLQKRRTEVMSRIHDYEARLAKTPEVEREYTQMIRDLEGTQLKYQEVRHKQMEAQLAQNLESERKGERFTLIEPPLVPQTPASPNRIAILFLGLIFSFAASAGVAVLMETLDGSIRSRRDLEALLPVGPLAVLPWIETDAERNARARIRKFSFAGAVTSVVLAAVLVHFLYRPLDVLWQVALRRLTG